MDPKNGILQWTDLLTNSIALNSIGDLETTSGNYHTYNHEEPQEVIFLHGIWRHIKEFGIEGQIPRISSPVKLEKRC